MLFPFALAGACFAASSTSALTTALIHRFDRGLGLAMGEALSGASAGGALMPPLLAWLSQNYDYHRALAMVCGAMVLVVWPLVILFIVAWSVGRCGGRRGGKRQMKLWP